MLSTESSVVVPDCPTAMELVDVASAAQGCRCVATIVRHQM
jgi:hypothetical protein